MFKITQPKLTKEILRKYSLILLMISLGFGTWISFLLFLFHIGIFYNKYLNLRFSRKFYTFYLFINLFIGSVFLIGYLNNTIPVTYIKVFIMSLFVSMIIVPLVYMEAENNFNKIIAAFGFGLFIKTTIVVGYSYLSGSAQYGYGKLWDPIIMATVNSPSYSNNYSLIFCIFLYLAYISPSLLPKILSILILLISVFGGLYLGGRTFFIVTAFFTMIFLFRVLRYKNLLPSLIIIVLLSLLTTFYYDALAHAFPTIFERVKHQSLQSTRYDLWLYALTQIPTHPFGGFNPPHSIEDVNWFHNIWLDTARTSGWMPLTFLIIVNLLILSLLLKVKKSLPIFLLWLITSILLFIFAQDVIVEGNIRLLFGYLIFNSILLKLAHNLRYPHARI